MSTQDIIDQYKIVDLVDKYGFVYFDIHQDMYGLKQAARIAFDRLVKLLKPNGYYPLQSNRVIWCHKTLPTKFALCVENSEINTLILPMLTILSIPFKNNTKYQSIGKGGGTVALL